MRRIANTYKVLIFIVAAFIAFNYSSTAAQNRSANKIDEKDFMNFWVGKWNLTWKNPDGSTSKGINNVKKILNSHVVQENLKVLTGPIAGFTGMSVSVYSPNEKLWHQTWVDNNGGYLDFVGKMENDKRIFFRYFVNSNHQEIIQRMVFYNIKKNSFDWDWMISNNEGKTWQVKWRIHYSRSKY